MSKELRFRKLRADEIQVRPTDTRTKGKALLLLYQDARCAMNILDETVGQFGWQKQYQNINGNIYCGIGIKNDDNDWVWKWDCGSFTAKEDDMQSKADASDATKRAAVCWGIARELYAVPRLTIKCPDSYYFNDKMNMSFTVSKIEWDDNDNLKELVVVDKWNHTVYDFANGGTSLFNAQNNTGMRVPSAPQVESIDNKASLIDFCKATKAEIGDNDQLTKFYKYYSQKSVEWTKYRVDWSDKWSKWNQPKNAA